ncbi:hypothetical protein CR105_03110 [Massilia eurypsychrophila]|uniref:Uncharacterized protein n=1 Tax=Massilia eurypsychrophila TaxID=1485217 RepID=A0A2G8TJ68_9BURK|nr:hypothetical protein [Massilia eurypsychrophila]PIL46095.1 hypothetical protein CR105_03110 [Massilia eurypsychrophila]
MIAGKFGLECDSTSIMRRKGRARPTSTASVVEDAPPPLTPAELRLLKSFRAVDDRSRDFMERVAAAQAARRSLHKQPTLHLVTGGFQ